MGEGAERGALGAPVVSEHRALILPSEKQIGRDFHRHSANTDVRGVYRYFLIL